MKTHRKFLLPLTALTSLFATDHAFANIQSPSDPIEPNITNSVKAAIKDNTLVQGNQNLFKFVLKQNDQGMKIAYHYSHESHSSHSSHYSSSSSY